MSTSIELLILNGLSQRIKSAFKLAQDPVNLPVSDVRHYFAEFKKQEGEKPSYPMVFFSLNQIQLAEHAATLNAELMGQYTSIARSGDTVTSIALVPAVFTFDLTVLDNSHVSMMAFLSKWLRISQTGALSFDINFDGVKVSIQAVLERSVSVPKREVAVDEAHHFEFTTTFQVNGYLSGDYEEESVQVPLLDKARSSLGVSVGQLPSQQAAPLTHQEVAERWDAYGQSDALVPNTDLAFTLSARSK